MKKFIVFGFLIFSLNSFTSAQESMFNSGDKVINLGLGIGSFYGSGLYYNTTIPPVSISFEKGIIDGLIDDKGVIGVGGYFGYTSYKWQYDIGSINYGWKYSNIVIGARGIFHYPLADKLDTYVGAMMGYNIVNSRSFGTNGGSYSYTPDSGSVLFSGFAGGRYYFSDNLSGFAELGYGIAYLTFGLGIKL